MPEDEGARAMRREGEDPDGRGQAPHPFGSWAALVAGVAAAALALTFRSATLLPAGFFDALAAAALGLGIAPFAHRLLGASAATIARGTGLAGGAVLSATSLSPPFDSAALPLAGWTLGAAFLQASTRARRVAPVHAALGVMLLAGGCVLAWYVAPSWPESTRLRATVAVGGAAALALLLVRLALAKRRPALAPSPAGLVAAAAIGATYVAYRPLVAGKVANLPLYEWTLGVGVAVLVLGRLRRSARDASVPEAWSGSARRHVEDAAPLYDARMPPLAAAIQRYLERGEGFAEYRAALLRAAPHAPPPFRKALQGMTPVQGRGRAKGAAARAARQAAHDALMDTMEPRHGDPAPDMRAHP